MGMLKGKVIGEPMVIQIAEIGAQGGERTFTVLSRDASGNVSTCEGEYGYMFEDGTIIEGDVRNTDLEKAFPVLKEMRIVRLYSMTRGNFMSHDRKWLHIDVGFGNHFIVQDAIAKELLDRVRGQDKLFLYMNGLAIVRDILKSSP